MAKWSYEPWRAVKEHVIQRFTTLSGCRDEDFKILLDLILPDQFTQRTRSQDGSSRSSGLTSGSVIRSDSLGIDLIIHGTSRVREQPQIINYAQYFSKIDYAQSGNPAIIIKISRSNMQNVYTSKHPIIRSQAAR